jgi:hypothetical protein
MRTARIPIIDGAKDIGNTVQSSIENPRSLMKKIDPNVRVDPYFSLCAATAKPLA